MTLEVKVVWHELDEEENRRRVRRLARWLLRAYETLSDDSIDRDCEHPSRLDDFDHDDFLEDCLLKKDKEK